MTLYLSRLCLLRNPSVDALSALIRPNDPAKRIDANHRLLWSAFAGDPKQQRDFLWRAEDKGVFHVLSRRPPEPSPFFEKPEIKEFTPKLNPGDRLSFLLRVNATRTRKLKSKDEDTDNVADKGDVICEDGGKSKRGRPVDIVMDALFHFPNRSSDRRAAAEKKMELAQTAATNWLTRQGEKSGFRLAPGPEEGLDFTVADYSVMALPNYRGQRHGQPQFGILDLAGTIEVTDPAAFLKRLAQGFGRARAFGCGLMMIRRSYRSA